MDVLASASFVLQNEALTQNRLTNDVNALATGLRVRSAVDDPSGYTIAQTLSTKVLGLQAAVTNTQTANNLLNVADGALSSIQSVLQRIRSLVVEANSDINSESDLENIQAEINQMLLEINKISSETNFNGLKLFTGQFQTPGTTSGAGVLGNFTPETPNSPNVATGQIGSNTLASGGAFVTIGNITVGSFVPAFTVFSVISASNNMIDPDTQTDIGPGVLIEEQVYSTSGGFGPTPLFVDYSALPQNTNTGFVPINAPYGYPSTNSGAQLFNADFGALTAADVGAQFAVLTNNPVAQPTGGHALAVNDGGDEGTTVSVSLPEINTTILQISDISVLDPGITGVINTGPGNYQWQVQGQSSSNNMPASYAEIRVDAALEQITSTRAAIGSQTVSTLTDVDDNDTAIVALQSSVSNIRDADVGATATDFTKQQILVSVGNSVLAQLQIQSKQVSALLLNSFNAPFG
jgi:flagellin